MARITANELRPEILRILQGAARGKTNRRITGLLTAYQILHRMDGGLQDRLRQSYGDEGKGAGWWYSAATRVAYVATRMPEVHTEYLDTRDLEFNVPGPKEAGYRLCGLFGLVSGRP